MEWQPADGLELEPGSSRVSAREEYEDGLPTDDLPACISCRRRKSKCSRERPSCSQCIRLRAECIYVTKQKPGLKAGAIDNIGSRLRVLEELFLDNAGNRKPQLAFLDADANANANAQPVSSDVLEPSDSATDSGVQQYEASNSAVADQSSSGDASSRYAGPRKRRRMDEPDQLLDAADGPWMPPLPSLRLLEAIVEAHFRTLHHWMPILHETRFRAKLRDSQERSRLAVVFHALASTSIKHVDLDDLGMTVEDAERQIRVSRRAVMLNAMESLSLENTQALVFLAFDYLGSGDVTRAWPIIGSLTRTANYLQLTMEPDDGSRKQQLLRSLSILEKSLDWTDSEGRRRLFWVIFLLDRICSVTSGWHTSLTSDDVHRRLPCGGGLWAREEPVSTPFFGIWDKSAARIGNSIANVPNMYTSPRPAEQPNTPSTSVADTSKLGAFAHCIEATENLSQVTAFFLQQDVDFGDRREVKDWLTRFKELDLRLVHWKMFLPQQWQDSNVSRDASVVKMDPNLTLAHITHNTSIILLHQHIAYPPASWKDVVKLPSSCSVETCQSAAVETASIVEKYLLHTGGIVNSQFAFCAFVAARVLLVQWRSSENNPLAPAFSILLESLEHMSARWLGRFARGSNDGPSPQEGYQAGKSDVAAKYASKLRVLQDRCAYDADFAPAGLAEILMDSSFEGFVEKQAGGPILPEQRRGSYASSGARTVDRTNGRPPIAMSAVGERPGQSRSPSTVSKLERQTRFLYAGTVAGSRLPRYDRPIMDHHGQLGHGTAMAAQGAPSHPQYGGGRSPDILSTPPNHVSNGMSIPGPVPMSMNHGFGHTQAQPNLSEEDELAAMSQMLLEHQFLQMDRVIRLDGTEFFNDAGDGLGMMS